MIRVIERKSPVVGIDGCGATPPTVLPGSKIANSKDDMPMIMNCGRQMNMLRTPYESNQKC
jgi:hypothetical protein